MADTNVVLRCPNCGTVQGSTGECEACHESAVRHYCENHSPGRWLDEPVCEECALRPKTIAPKSSAPKSSAPKSTAPKSTSRKSSAGAGTPPVSTKSARRVPPPFTPEEWTVKPPPTAEPRRADTVSLEELFESLRAAGSRSRTSSREDMPSRLELPDLVRSRGVPAAFGCLKRLAVLAVIGAILFAMAAAWFFSSVIVVGIGSLPLLAPVLVVA